MMTNELIEEAKTQEKNIELEDFLKYENALKLIQNLSNITNSKIELDNKDSVLNKNYREISE